MTYELLYIISSACTDVETEELMKKVAGLVEGAGGEIKRHTSMGRFALAYPIKRQKYGTYVLLRATMPGDAVKKVERTLRLDYANQVLRHLVSVLSPVEESAVFEMVAYTYPLAETGFSTGGRDDRRRSRPVSAAAPLVAAPVEAALSVEELDKKLDEILEDDSLTNV